MDKDAKKTRKPVPLRIKVLIAWLCVMAIAYYAFLPPLNIRSPYLWFCVLAAAASLWVISIFAPEFATEEMDRKEKAAQDNEKKTGPAALHRAYNAWLTTKDGKEMKPEKKAAFVWIIVKTGIAAFVSAFALSMVSQLPAAICGAVVLAGIFLFWSILESDVAEDAIGMMYEYDPYNYTYTEKPMKTRGLKKTMGMVVAGLAAVFVLIMLIGSPVFRASSYASIIESNVVRKNFSEYTPTIDNVPLMDRDTAELLANRTMGTLVSEVSQYKLSRSWQINYRGKPVRVAPLEYAGVIKWINNRSDGIPSFIVVDMSTQKTDIRKVEGGIHYSPGSFFSEDLIRHIRFEYPHVITGDPTFEIDEEGNPYWIVPKLTKRVGLFGGTDVEGALIVDAVTGEISDYSVEEVPSYADNVFPARVVMDLYNLKGKYSGGFLNSVFGQKGVVQVTEGYNYIPKDDDVYVYTGVTSVSSDESNIGFIFANMRTKEYEYYEVPGAEEFSAMSSAEGVVQHLGYTSTFPLLLSIEGQPTYCMALKDAGGLVKMYGLVNMSQYQIVTASNTIESCLKEYRQAMKGSGNLLPAGTEEVFTGTVEDIRTGSLNGTTVFYIKFEKDERYYEFSLADNETIVLVNVGDVLEYEAAKDDERIIPALLVELK